MHKPDEPGKSVVDCISKLKTHYQVMYDILAGDETDKELRLSARDAIQQYQINKKDQISVSCIFAFRNNQIWLVILKMNSLI